ncbi:MAG: hypothetical protein AAGC79_13570, partial [Pseudomonadota bacterium]
MAEIEDANKPFAQIGALAPVNAVVFNEKELSWIIQLSSDIQIYGLRRHPVLRRVSRKALGPVGARRIGRDRALSRPGRVETP